MNTVELAVALQTCIAATEIGVDLQIEVMGSRTPIHQQARSRLTSQRPILSS